MAGNGSAQDLATVGKTDQSAGACQAAEARSRPALASASPADSPPRLRPAIGLLLLSPPGPSIITTTTIIILFPAQLVLPSLRQAHLPRSPALPLPAAALREPPAPHRAAAPKRAPAKWCRTGRRLATPGTSTICSSLRSRRYDLRSSVPPVRSLPAIREFLISLLEAGLGDVEMESLRLEILGEIALDLGRCKMLVPVAMGKRREERGKYLVVLVRQPAGTWKILADCWSSDLAVSPALDRSESPANHLNRNASPAEREVAGRWSFAIRRARLQRNAADIKLFAFAND